MQSVKQTLAQELRQLSVDDAQFFSKLHTHIDHALHELKVDSLEAALKRCHISPANKAYIKHLHHYIEQESRGNEIDLPEALVHSKDNFYEVIIEQVIDMFELLEVGIDAD